MDSKGSGSQIVKTVKRYATLAALLAAMCYAVVGALYFNQFNGGFSTKTSTWGEFGDFVGGTLNPLLGTLSLLALLGTLLIQSKELSDSTQALQEQGLQLKLQAFENTFFSLIALSNENIRSLSLEETENKENYQPGRGVFRPMKRKLEDTYERISRHESKGLDESQIISKSVEEFDLKTQRFIGHYLGTIEKIISFIEQRCPDNLNKTDYYRIVQSQLTPNELVIIFYSTFNPRNLFDLKTLNHHNFFSALRDDDLLNATNHSNLILGVKNGI